MGGANDILQHKLAFIEYPITEDLTFLITPVLSKWISMVCLLYTLSQD